MKKVVIIHTTLVTIPSMRALIEKRNRNIEIRNLLDDSILPEINEAGRITENVKTRIFSMLTMAASIGPDAVLCACSSIGGVVEEGRKLLDIPVLRIDEPMAEKAVGTRTTAGRLAIGVVGTLMSTMQPTMALLERKASVTGRQICIESHVIENVGSLLSEGKEKEYDEQVAAVLMELLKSNEIVVLAQASMARAVESVPAQCREKLLTSPESGVAALCGILGE